ncbi:peroxiredoxin [Chlamydia pecorum]|uniref:Thioredoxin peroxidase n=1 Tax=Chlamydia pecorum (strain ATCC VR-628 / DSM 29919 / E58) TaxID=331635 RepID=A0AA34RCM2_CHLPE|nr:peroxiredoxin [Chlamydia pecorum]AEB41274.1 antioxidant, AhpC/Tsa family [Chlamydia pecorum E58]AGW40257.1 antioxidant, AhpC/Tsa family [Chlamydia pecorum P787]ETF38630.1 AhpC/Tsa family antioxidant [Chlamydia pecorum VR629]ETF39135.1 AhpC/Tsa family antioxidant [Chlamydia pecorum DBDeUG]UBV32762.1 antioxidant, AhpC/Tsa family [Chlamydia pecorum]
MSAFLIGKSAPDFVVQAVVDGEETTISLKDYLGKYVVLFFYPKDFTYVCPTELHAFQEALEAFQERGAVVLGCSVDDIETHKRWLNTEKRAGGVAGITYPLLSDVEKTMSADYGVLLPKEELSLRGVFLIDKEGIVRHLTINDLPLGRSIEEELRVLDALIFFEAHGLVCPANWRVGEKAMAPNEAGLQSYFETLD